MARWRVVASVREESGRREWRGHTFEIEAGPDRPTDGEVLAHLAEMGMETYHVAAVIPADDDPDPHADTEYLGGRR